MSTPHPSPPSHDDDVELPSASHSPTMATPTPGGAATPSCTPASPGAPPPTAAGKDGNDDDVVVVGGELSPHAQQHHHHHHVVAVVPAAATAPPQASCGGPPGGIKPATPASVHATHDTASRSGPANDFPTSQHHHMGHHHHLHHHPQPHMHRSNVPAISTGCGGSGADFTAMDQATIERELEMYRARCFTIVVVQLVLSVVCLPFVWIGFGFVFIAAGMMLVFNVVAVVRLRSIEKLRTSTCCCLPLSAVRHMHSNSVILTIFTFIGFAACLIQLVLLDSSSQTTKLTFVILAMLLMAISLVVAGVATKSLAQLKNVALLDEAIQAGPTDMTTVPPCGGVAPVVLVAAPGGAPAYYHAATPYLVQRHAAPPPPPTYPVPVHHHHHHHHQGGQQQAVLVPYPQYAAPLHYGATVGQGSPTPPLVPPPVHHAAHTDHHHHHHPVQVITAGQPMTLDTGSIHGSVHSYPATTHGAVVEGTSS